MTAALGALYSVGYLNYIHPYRVQIVGRREVAYLSQSNPEVAERRISRIVTLEPPAKRTIGNLDSTALPW